MGRRITLVVLMITIISLGLTNPAYAQNAFNFPQEYPLDFFQNFVHATWNSFTQGNNQPPVMTGEDAFFADTNNYVLYDESGFVTEMDCDANFLCTFRIANLVDNLPYKIIEVEVEYDVGGADLQNPPTLGSISAFVDSGSSTCLSLSTTQYAVEFNPQQEAISESFTFFIGCIVNPDWESMQIQLDDNVKFVEFWTESFTESPPQVVGGTFVPIDTTALLLAGVQSISMWMIPVVVAVIGIGVFVIKRRK